MPAPDEKWFRRNRHRSHRLRLATPGEVSALQRVSGLPGDTAAVVTCIRKVSRRVLVRVVFPVQRVPKNPDQVPEYEAKVLFEHGAGSW